MNSSNTHILKLTASSDAMLCVCSVHEMVFVNITRKGPASVCHSGTRVHLHPQPFLSDTRVAMELVFEVVVNATNDSGDYRIDLVSM